MTASAEPSAEAAQSVAYGSWGRRCVAFILDYLILTIPLVIVLMSLPSSSDVEGLVLVFGWPVIALLYGGYFIGLHGGKRGQTLGKRLLQIAVRDSQSLGRIGYAKAFGRLLSTLVLWSFFWIPGIVDALWPLRDSRSQALHDKMVGTVVVRV